jgi:hypothetical protein
MLFRVVSKICCDPVQSDEEDIENLRPQSRVYQLKKLSLAEVSSLPHPGGGKIQRSYP